MKTTRKILATLVATAIIATGTISTYAMGNGQGMGKGQHKGQGQNSTSETKILSNPGDMISNIATGSLSEQEKLDLAYQYSEEKVAFDAYTYFYGLYGVQTFKNIADSESEHMTAVKVLLDRYSLPTPTNYGELQSTFDTLKTEGEKSLQSALEVGLKIEMLDIEDIKDTIKTTDNDDLKIVFTNIGGASYNHLRGFAKGLSNAGLTTSIDYSKYLSQEQVNSKASLKHLLSENLVSEGFSLPEKASSSKIKENCNKEDLNQKAREGYKNQIDKKYGNSLKKLDEEKLQKVSGKLDSSIEKLENNSSISDKIKEKTLNIYNALKEYINELLN